MSEIISRFFKDPCGFVQRVFFKKLIGPQKYGRGDDYDAARYWQDRLSRYGDSLKGVGDEGKSDRENIAEYTRDEKIFTEFCSQFNLDYPKTKVLDIGCGSGFYAEILSRLGVRDYTGLDITDTLFEKHRLRFPSFSFIKKDFTSEVHDDKYDLIIMIEVLEHIVNDDKLTFAMENVKRCLKNNGIFILSSIWKTGGRHMFYVRKWTLEEIRERFTGYHFSPLVPFRSSQIVAIKRATP